MGKTDVSVGFHSLFIHDWAMTSQGPWANYWLGSLRNIPIHLLQVFPPELDLPVTSESLYSTSRALSFISAMSRACTF